MFELRKYLMWANDHVEFYIKSNSESFQICSMVSLYHTHQYVGVYKLTYFMIFYIFWCFIAVFTLKNVAWENVKFSDLNMFPIKFSSESLQICYINTLLHTNVCDYKLIYFIIFLHFRLFFSVFTLKNVALEYNYIPS